MHLTRYIATALLVKLSQGIGIPQDETVQQPISEPKDNFTLTPIRDALVSNKVIPDVLNDFEPMYYLDITYPKHNVKVALGNEISVKDVKKRPIVGIYLIPDKNKPPVESFSPTFTLALTDPDATSRYDPKWSEMCHWLVTNITFPKHAADMTDGRIELDFTNSVFVDTESSNEDKDVDVPELKKRDSTRKHGKHKKHKKDHKLNHELESYKPPGPPPKTGLHRYIFVLLQGDATHLQAPPGRKHWGYGVPRHGVRDYAIQNRLEVVGANFFFAKNKIQ